MLKDVLPQAVPQLQSISGVTVAYLVTTPLSCGAGNVTRATVTAQAQAEMVRTNTTNNQGWTTDNFYVTNTAGPVNVLVRDTNLCVATASRVLS
jgi:hypothetical protein